MAGASAVDVSPRTLPVIRNGGFLEATDDRVVDPLYARCLVLSDGKQSLALIVVDSCMIPRELCDQAKATIEARTGIPADRVMIAATHTHAAPSVMDYCLGSRADPNYTPALPGWITAAVEQAMTRLQPAQVAWTTLDAGSFTHCRRWITRPDAMLTDPFGAVTVRANMHPGHLNPGFTGPSGPTNPWLTLLSVQTTEGQPLALLANFSMHYFSGHSGISSDYFGRYAYQMQQQLAPDNPQFVAMMSQGTSGDLWWGDYSRAADAFRPEMDQFARGLVQQSCDAIKHLQYEREAPLAMAERRMTLARRRPDATRLAWAREMLSRMGDRRPENQSEVYAEQAIYLDEHPECEVVLQAVRVGEFGIATWPNEVYGLSGLKIHLQSPLPYMMNIELANGAAGYIPPPEQHRLGGYNTWPARTAGLEEQAEPKIVATLLELLEDVAGHTRREVTETTGPAARAVLDLKPVAYYRCAELQGTTLSDASGHGHAARLVGNFAFYLPGVDRGAWIASSALETNANTASGTAMDTQSPSSGPDANRAVHCVGGRIETPFRPVGPWSAELWVWNGLLPETRPVAGTILADGDTSLQLSGSDAATPGCLMIGNHVGSRPLGRFAWHHVAYLRGDRSVDVYLDGQLELSVPVAAIPADSAPICIAADAANSANWEGRIDELALYDHLLDVNIVAKHARPENTRGSQATPATDSE
jgi:hypothetical protein